MRTSTSSSTRPASTIDMTITSPVSLFSFISAALKGSTTDLELNVRSTRLRGNNVPGTKVTVSVRKAEPEDGSGMLFIFEGRLHGRNVKGFVNTKSTVAPGNYGYVNYV